MPSFWEVGYWALVGTAAAISFLLCYALTLHTTQTVLEQVKTRRARNTYWEPETRIVDKQTWVVVRQIHYGLFGQRIIAEQLIGIVLNNLSDYPHQLERSQRIAELRAAWLNSGQPETPVI